MMKRTISLLLALSICLCMVFVPAQAADMKYDAAATAQRTEALKALGVMDYEVTEEMYTQPVPRAALYGAGMGLLGDLTDPIQYQEYTFGDIAGLPEANKIQFACQMGTLEASWKFDPAVNGRVGEFVKLVVSVLGYREVAEEQGNGETGFMTVANRINLLKGVSVSKDDTLVWEDMIAMLYNALDVELMHLVGYESSTVRFLEITGMTALNFYFDIYKVRGVVEANEYTAAVPDGQMAGEDRVRIGGDSMRVGDTNAADLLGYHVEGYAKEENDIYTMVYVDISSQNRTWYMAGEDLMPNDPGWSQYCIVYQDEKGTIRRLTLPTDVAVIYNGKEVFDFTADDLNVLLGSLTVIDNDNDGTPEVVLVDEYENYIVDNVNISSYTIRSKNMPELSLEDAEEWSLVSVNGDEYPLEEISEYTILSISASKDKSLIHGVVVKEKLSGQVTGIRTVGGKTVLNLDATEVTVSPAWPTTSYDGKPEIDLSKRYVIYLDKNGEAAAFDEKSSGMMYAFLWDASVSGNFDKTAQLRLFTDSGTWEDLEAAEDVTLNGVEYTRTEFAGLLEDKTISTMYSGGALIQQMVKVELNNENVITKIYTPGGSSEDEALSAAVAITGTYKSSGMSISNFQWGLNGTQIFFLPAVMKKDDKGKDVVDYYLDEDFAVGGTSVLKNDKKYTFTAYDLSDTMIPEVVTTTASLAAQDYWNNYAVYVKNVLEIFENGETYIALDCINKGKEVVLRAKKDEYIEMVKQGDVLITHMDDSGLIDDTAVVMYEKGTYAPTDRKQIIVSGDNSQYIYCGTIAIKDDSNLLIQTGGINRTVSMSAIKYVTFYDETAKDGSEMFRIGSVSEVSKGAKVLFYARADAAMDLIVFE